MNGHSDVVMGAAITHRDDLAERLRFLQNGKSIRILPSMHLKILYNIFCLNLAMGIVPSPFDCAMVNRSLKTLELRMQQHMKNCLAIAKFLESHPYVEKVLHPCTYLYNFLFLSCDICS